MDPLFADAVLGGISILLCTGWLVLGCAKDDVKQPGAKKIAKSQRSSALPTPQTPQPAPTRTSNNNQPSTISARQNNTPVPSEVMRFSSTDEEELKRWTTKEEKPKDSTKEEKPTPKEEQKSGPKDEVQGSWVNVELPEEPPEEGETAQKTQSGQKGDVPPEKEAHSPQKKSPEPSEEEEEEQAETGEEDEERVLPQSPTQSNDLEEEKLRCGHEEVEVKTPEEKVEAVEAKKVTFGAVFGPEFSVINEDKGVESEQPLFSSKEEETQGSDGSPEVSQEAPKAPKSNKVLAEELGAMYEAMAVEAEKQKTEVEATDEKQILSAAETPIASEETKVDKPVASPEKTPENIPTEEPSAEPSVEPAKTTSPVDGKTKKFKEPAPLIKASSTAAKPRKTPATKQPLFSSKEEGTQGSDGSPEVSQEVPKAPKSKKVLAEELGAMYEAMAVEAEKQKKTEVEATDEKQIVSAAETPIASEETKVDKPVASPPENIPAEKPNAEPPVEPAKPTPPVDGETKKSKEPAPLKKASSTPAKPKKTPATKQPLFSSKEEGTQGSDGPPEVSQEAPKSDKVLAEELGAMYKAMAVKAEKQKKTEVEATDEKQIVFAAETPIASEETKVDKPVASPEKTPEIIPTEKPSAEPPVEPAKPTPPVDGKTKKPKEPAPLKKSSSTPAKPSKTPATKQPPTTPVVKKPSSRVPAPPAKEPPMKKPTGQQPTKKPTTTEAKKPGAKTSEAKKPSSTRPSSSGDKRGQQKKGSKQEPPKKTPENKANKHNHPHATSAKASTTGSSKPKGTEGKQPEKRAAKPHDDKAKKKPTPEAGKGSHKHKKHHVKGGGQKKK